MSFYNEMQNMTYEMIVKYGKEMTITSEIDKKSSDADGSEITNKLSTTVYGLETEYSDILQSTDSPIQKGDKSITITTTKGKPKVGDNLLSSGVLHRIISVKETNPGGVALMYEVRARSYALSEFEDTLTRKLGFLEPGSIVADVERDDLASWMVIAQNHYTPGYTTLIMDQMFQKERQAFNGSGTYPTFPWTATWLRKYLSTTIANTFSTKMLGALKQVEITTNNTVSSDTIYVLSKEELSGVERLGFDSGDFIPYFSVESKRIATYGGENASYWTREGAAVGSDGKFINANPNYAYGVRAVINLRSSLDTALNLGGEYEIQWP